MDDDAAAERRGGLDLRWDDPRSGSTAFPVGAGRRAGLTRHLIDRADLDRPHHGIRASIWRDADRARDLLPALRPGDRFSHLTAARLWPLPLPRRWQAVGGPVHVSGPADGNRLRRVGVIGHRTADAGYVVRNGLPLSRPTTLFLELATELELDDLVAVGDALVRRPIKLDPHDIRPWIDLDELRAAVSRASRGRGVRLARSALALVREGSDSPAETRLRLAVLRAGFPTPQLNPMIVDRRRREIGHFDLVWPERRIIAEYDGDQHRTDPRQYDRDITRFDRATDAGYRVVRFRARALYPTPQPAIRSLTRAFAAAPRP
ncbi:DUF559 domain-containing protein [Schumannella soli]|uniref:DUF559 domain-containing protein n=1 Tax=Schumannella soli TaxID=2590779 RepID=A0A506Y969_9MICO|nr:DUF559 domain-containing protein [Schumannella soli]TPW77618.1 DUF559 domain-containing protein [Schumannella soli]